MLGSGLPNGWREKQTADGRIFYLDDVSEQTTWARPTQATLADGWSVRYDNTGRKYYVNDSKKTTQWDVPPLASRGTNWSIEDQPDYDLNASAPSAPSAPVEDKWALPPDYVNNELPGRYASRSKFPMPSQFTASETLENPGYKSSFQVLADANAPRFTDKPPGYNTYERRESSTWKEVLSRQTINFWIHAALCFGVWTCAILAAFESMFFGAIIAFGVGWALMALAGCCSDTRGYLNNIQFNRSPYEYESTLRASKGTINWTVQCYHYETRRTTDSKGKTKTKRVRVNTHRASKNYVYHGSRDVSAELPNIESFKVMQLNSETRFGFADAETRNHYNTNLSIWRKNHDRDRHQDFSMSWNVLGLIQYALWEREEGAIPPCARNPVAFLVCTALSFGFLWRLWFEKFCGHTKWVCEKEISQPDLNQSFA